MKTITVTDSLAARIECMRNKENYLNEKIMLCKTLAESIFNLIDGEFEREEDKNIAYFLSLYNDLIDEFAQDKEEDDTKAKAEEEVKENALEPLEEKRGKIYEFRKLSTF